MIWRALSACLSLYLLGGIALAAPPPAPHRESQTEASPLIRPEAGFTAKILAPPGRLDRPSFMIPHGNVVWMIDAGASDAKILELTPDGDHKVAMSGKLPMLSGFDWAPPDFGSGDGQLFARAEMISAGRNVSDLIEQINLTRQSSTSFCSLPRDEKAGAASGGIRFGPDGTSFANTLFVTMPQGKIDAAYPDGTCVAFADVSKFGAPAAISFSADGSSMLVTTGPGEGAAGAAKGMILRIGSEGEVDPKPAATGLTQPIGLDLAPVGFGAFTAEIFVVDQGDAPQGAPPNGKVYRVAGDGQLKLVASGFDHPVGLRFVGEHLWVTGGGDSRHAAKSAGRGYLVEIDAK